MWLATGAKKPLADDSLIALRTHFNDAIAELVELLQSDAIKTIDSTDRQNLAKYLTIVKVRLENAIGVVRRGKPN